MEEVKRSADLLVLSLILCSLIVAFPCCHIVEAISVPLPEPALTIKSDGSVDPSTAPIHRDGDVYTFTDNIVGYTVIVQKDDIILDGGGYTLKGYGSEGNFTLKGYADPAGILIMHQFGVTIRNMKISGFSYGIQLMGMFTLASGNITLENNLVEDNYYGVYLSGSWFTVLRNNRMNNNIRNFYVYDYVSVLPPAPNIYINDIDSSNTVDGNPIIYWVNEQDKTVPSNAGYVALVNCTNMTVQNLDLAHNGQGIVLVSTTNSLITKNHVINTDWGIFAHNSSNIVITENNLESNDVGISVRRFSNSSISLNNLTRNGGGASLVGSENIYFSCNNITRNTGNGLWLNGLRNSTVEQNSITENNEAGVSLLDSHDNWILVNTITSSGYYGIKLWEGSSENTISENLIANNRWGLQLTGTPNNNIIYHNDFLNNANHVETDDSNGVWDNGEEGNYWDNYRGLDSDEDGIGDTPYIIDEHNQDNRPLMEPIIVPEEPIASKEFPYFPFNLFPEPDSVDVLLDTNISICISRPPSIVNMSISPKIEIKERIDEVIDFNGRYTFILSELLEPSTTYNVTVFFSAQNSTRTWKFTTMAEATEPKLEQTGIGFPIVEVTLAVSVIVVVFAVLYYSRRKLKLKRNG
jgi:parallel beta-helix repeat protein